MPCLPRNTGSVNHTLTNTQNGGALFSDDWDPDFAKFTCVVWLMFCFTD
jgi:hypothetical protein